ncbi:hypothetical protein Tco_1279317 [Tanacetum coccineum]
MKGAPECMKISGFMHGVNNLELTKRLNEHVPKTLEETMTTTTAFIRGETAAASKNKVHTPWKPQDQSKDGANLLNLPPLSNNSAFFGKIGRDTIQLEDTMSTISQEYLLEFSSEYFIPENLHPELPGPGDHIIDFPEGKIGSGYQQKDRKPSQNDKTEHGMEKTVQNQGQSPKMSKSESILKNQQSNRSRN